MALKASALNQMGEIWKKLKLVAVLLAPSNSRQFIICCGACLDTNLETSGKMGKCGQYSLLRSLGPAHLCGACTRGI